MKNVVVEYNSFKRKIAIVFKDSEIKSEKLNSGVREIIDGNLYLSKVWKNLFNEIDHKNKYKLLLLMCLIL